MVINQPLSTHPQTSNWFCKILWCHYSFEKKLVLFSFVLHHCQQGFGLPCARHCSNLQWKQPSKMMASLYLNCICLAVFLKNPPPLQHTVILNRSRTFLPRTLNWLKQIFFFQSQESKITLLDRFPLCPLAGPSKQVWHRMFFFLWDCILGYIHSSTMLNIKGYLVLFNPEISILLWNSEQGNNLSSSENIGLWEGRGRQFKEDILHWDCVCT